MPLGILFVHGIGTHRRDWAAAASADLGRSVLKQINALRPGSPTPSLDDVLLTDAASWDVLLQERQDALRAILAASGETSEAAGPWWSGWWRAAWRCWRRKERTVVSHFIGDIIAYLDPATQRLVHGALTDALARLGSRLGPGQDKQPLTIIAHSLGTVISSDYVWDAAKTRSRRQAPGFHEQFQLENFFTVGSPMALFALRYGGAEAFNQPIRMEAPRGRWVNVFDPDDPVAMPLTPLNAAYAAAVLRDVSVQAGAYLLSHTRYFTHSPTLEIIGRKLALDWLTANALLPTDRLETLYAEYDRTAGLPA